MSINLIQIYSVPHFVLVNISFEFFSFCHICVCIYLYLGGCTAFFLSSLNYYAQYTNYDRKGETRAHGALRNGCRRDDKTNVVTILKWQKHCGKKKVSMREVRERNARFF